VSRASGYVRFPDGEIKAFIYDGTVDVVYPALFKTSIEAWGAYRSVKDGNEAWAAVFEPEAVRVEEEVEVYSDYGSGFWWKATATRNRILTKLDWDDFYEDLHDGAPSWLTERH
jgi:hypothetical protein